MKIQIKVETVKNWTTHMTMLLKVMFNSTGDVLEIGGGTYSTPLLHWICKMQNRKLYTYENDPTYYRLEKGFQSANHRVRFIENWDDIPVKKYGVVFIDNHPDNRRVDDLLRYKDHADYIIMHDTEKEEKYRLKEAYPHFKYMYTWTACKPWTSVFSNFKNLSFLE